MRTTNSACTVTAGLALSVVLVFPATIGATSVDTFFNNMSEDAEQAYVLTMAKVAEKVLADAGKPDLARQVEALFAAQRNDGGAVEEFLEAVDQFARNEIVREVAGTPSQDGPFRIEEMMAKHLKDHHIELPPAFMAIAKAGKMQETAARVIRPRK